MITRVRIVRFKRFADHEFDLAGGTVLLAGPNNSGKTTLLHALSAWHLALRNWLAERGEGGGKRRISVALDEFTALPLREMNLLWLNRHTAARVPHQKQPRPAPIYIQVATRHGQRIEQALTIEFMYANEKLVYVRPVSAPDSPEPVDGLPDWAKNIQVAHVPAFSGIGTQEPRHTIGIQRKLVGEGRPGEVVRNLLLDIWEKSGKQASREPWNHLAEHIERLFQCDLLPPEFSDARAYIVSEYRPKASSTERSSRSPKLDVANAGSGFHQVLLLLAFFYARPSSVLLLDEPDAHLHFILQREIFDVLRAVAQRRNCKLIVATHSEVLLERAEPDQIVSFVGQQPRRLVAPEEKQRVREALPRLNALDLLQADHVQAVLYVEDESDHAILREWAQVLGHAASAFLKFPYIVPLKGKGNLNDAKQHFQSLRLAKPEIKGLCVLDRDAASPRTSTGEMPDGMALRMWTRYEIENYLLIPDLLKRFVREEEPLFAQADEKKIDEEFAANFPARADYLGDLQALRDLKGSEFLVRLLQLTDRPLSKADLFMLAALSRPERRGCHAERHRRDHPRSRSKHRSERHAARCRGSRSRRGGGGPVMTGPAQADRAFRGEN